MTELKVWSENEGSCAGAMMSVWKRKLYMDTDIIAFYGIHIIKL